MPLKRYDTLRLQLIRLYQAMEEHRDLAREMFPDSSLPQGRAGRADPSTLRVLPTIEGSRRHVRIKDRVSLIYSESPEIGEERIPNAAGGKSAVDLSRWLQEVAGQKNRRLNLDRGVEMRIHLQEFEDTPIYFIAFRADDPDRKDPLPLHETEMSGAGMSFPTEICHSVGEDLLVVYFLPTDPFPPLQLVTQVVRPGRRHPRGGYQTPVKVVDISQGDHRRIMEYIATRQRQKSLLKAYSRGR
jgi:hypothetical protein